MKRSIDKMEKKCLLASVTLHAFLVIVVLVGSAFIIPKTNPPFTDPVRMIPSKLIDEALSGGGGNPNAPRTDDVKKGNTTVPQPPVAEIPAPVKHEIKSTPPPPAPAAKPEPVKPKPDKAKPEKVEKLASKEKPPKEPTPTKPSKTESKIPVKDSKNAPLELKPVVRDNDSKRKAEESKRIAEQKSRTAAEAREARESAKRWAETNKKLEIALGKAADHLEEGFANGTKVDVSGPGGEAYANYGAFVQAIYDDAWDIFRDLASNDFATTVKVTIARDGTVTAARIIQRSGNPAMDKSVQKALDKVKFVHPFPEGSTDKERSFTIEFNLKAKRLYG